MYSQVDAVKKLRKNRTVLKTILLLFLVFIELFMCFPFPIFFIIFGFFLLLPIFKEKRFFKSILSYILLIAFMSGTSHIRLNLDFKDGEKIVYAIEEYKKVEGSYPEKLEDLVPNQLEKIPFNWTCYHEWIYSKRDGEESYLFVFLPYGFEKCTFNFNKKKWHCRD